MRREQEKCLGGGSLVDSDTDRVEIERSVSLSAPGPHAFLLVTAVNPKGWKDTDSEWWESVVKDHWKVLDKIQELCGERAVRNTMILFTCGDYLQGRTIEQYIEEAGEEFQQLVEKCGNRYHVLNNKNKSNHTQVTQLLEKIDSMVKRSGGCYIQISPASYQELVERIRLKEQELKRTHKKKLRREGEMKNKYEEEQRKREQEMKQKYEEEQCRREKEMKQKYEEEQCRRKEEMKQKYEEEQCRRKERDGQNQSAGERAEEGEGQNQSAGERTEEREEQNQSAGERAEEREGQNQITAENEKRTGEVSGRRVTVVNTPDLLDTDRVEIERSVSLSAPGPHTFLLVTAVNPKGWKDTDSEWWESVVKDHWKVLDKIQELCGERAVRNMMILFTCGDYLQDRTIEQYIEEAGEEFQQLVEKCGNRYHVLNNKNKSNHTQVTQLLEKIDSMVKRSGGCYIQISPASYQELVERIRLKEQELKRTHKKELRRREGEMKNKYEEEQRKREQEMKQKYEEEQCRREEEMKQKYEEEQRKREQEMKQKYEEEQRKREQEMKQKYEEEQCRREEEIKQKYEEEQYRREEEMKQKYEEQYRREEEMKQKYEEEQRKREQEMKQKY
ncbi:UNVERIFIED_CONTAM: hypothetical protein FKN15_076075 [Acipenser sinensis]